MSIAQHIRVAAQHDDWRGYVCPLMNKVLTAFLVPGVDVPPAPTEHVRTYMLVVAEALDGGAAGVKGTPAADFWCDKVPHGGRRCDEQCALCAEAAGVNGPLAGQRQEGQGE